MTVWQCGDELWYIDASGCIREQVGEIMIMAPYQACMIKIETYLITIRYRKKGG